MARSENQDELWNAYIRVFFYGAIYGLIPLAFTVASKVINKNEVTLCSVLSSGHLLSASISMCIFCLILFKDGVTNKLNKYNDGFKFTFITLFLVSAVALFCIKFSEVSPDLPSTKDEHTRRFTSTLLGLDGPQKLKVVVNSQVIDSVESGIEKLNIKKAIHNWHYQDQELCLHYSITSALIVLMTILACRTYIKRSLSI